MNFNPYAFIENLPILLKGMLGMFVTLGIIALSIVILNKFSKGDNK